MELNSYGITLQRLNINKIELIRNWRNDPKISQYMFSKDFITSEMQLEWFNKINNEFNFYFILKYNNEEIGLFNIKNIDYIKKCGETGSFIYEDKFLGSEVPFRATYCLLDFIFEELKLDYVHGQMLPNNKNAIKFNKFFGADINFSEDKKRLSYTLTKEKYFKHRNTCSLIVYLKD